MKRLMTLFLIAVLLVPVLCGCTQNQTVVPPTTAQQLFQNDSYRINTTKTPTGESVSSIIQNTFSAQSVTNLLTQQHIYRSDYIDLSVYAVAYSVHEENVEGEPTLCLNNQHPTIYVPLFGTVKEEKRIVGHVQFAYNSSRKQYVQTPVILNVTSEGFLQGEQKHFLEQIGILDSYQPVTETIPGSDPSNLILVQMSTGHILEDMQVLAQTDAGIMVHKVQYYRYDP